MPLADRVVEVIADLGSAVSPRYRYGSGCVVAGRVVVTAAHTVAGAAAVRIRDVGKVAYEAMRDPRFTGDLTNGGPDLALLEIGGNFGDLPPIGLAALDRASATGLPVERCSVVGYPLFMERPAADGGVMRDTVAAYGHVPVLSGLASGLVSMNVSSAPRDLPAGQTSLATSPWSGMSGAPLFVEGRLLAVVTEHAPRQGTSTLTATPLTAVEPDRQRPRWGAGVGDPEAWWRRLGVSGLADLIKLPASRRGEPPPYHATVHEIHRRTPLLVGREGELDDVRAFATGDERYRWLTAPAYAGKTSLLAEAVVAALPPDVDVVCYFLSRRESDADSARFFAAVAPQLAHLLDVDPAPATDVHTFRDLWQRAAARAAAGDRHLLLVVDGLDEDLRPHGLPSIAAILPTAVGGRAHVLVSSRPHPTLPTDLPPGHPLGAASVSIEPFRDAERLAALATGELDQLARGQDGQGVEILGLLAAAAGALAVDDLAALIDAGNLSPPQRRRRVRRLVTQDAARSLQPTGPDAAPRYQFAHDLLLAHARAHADLADAAYRDRIHHWAQRWRAAGWPLTTTRASGTPRYLVDEYVSTLNDDPHRLAELVADPGWIDLAIRTVGVDQAVASLRLVLAVVPYHRGTREMFAAVIAQAHNLRPPAPVRRPGFVAQQLCQQAAELGQSHTVDVLRTRLTNEPGATFIPRWTTRRASRSFAGQLTLKDFSTARVPAVAALPDGRVVTGDNHGRLQLWDPARPGAAPVELGWPSVPVWAVAVLPDGRVVSVDDFGRVMLWDPAQPGTLFPTVLGSHRGTVRAAAMRPDGRVVTGGFDGLIRLWDPARPGADPVELGRQDAQVWAVGVLPDGRLVTGGGDARIRLWDPAEPGADPVEVGEQDGPVWALAVLPDGRVVSVGDWFVRLWDPARPGADPTKLAVYEVRVQTVAVLPDGQVVTGSFGGRVLLSDPAQPSIEAVVLGGHASEVAAVAVLPDGRVVSGGNDGRVLLWDPTQPGDNASEYPTERSTIDRALVVLPDARVVSFGSEGVRLWDPARPGADPVVLGRYVHVEAVAVLPDGRVVSGDRDGRIRLWDPTQPGADPAELGEQDGPLETVAALPDGRVVTGDNHGRLQLWDPARPGAHPVALGQHAGMAAVAVPPGGRVVSGDRDGRILLWDPAQPGADPDELGLHASMVTALAALPDGRVVSFGSDMVRLWDPARPGAVPVELGRHTGMVWMVTVLPDGRVATGGLDMVRLWDPTRPGADPIQLRYSVDALASGHLPGFGDCLVACFAKGGLAAWSVLPAEGRFEYPLVIG